jgi:hypothetical protein
LDIFAGFFSIVFGLALCFRWKEWGEALARRHIAYDAVWFYQLSALLFGLCFVALGIAQLLGWLQ